VIRVVRTILAVAFLFVTALALPVPTPTLACSGSVDLAAGAAQGTVIVLAEAELVGDAANRQPTPGPASPPRATSAPPAQKYAGFDLAGVGATLRVVRAYTPGVDVGAPLVIDAGVRSSIERELRAREAGGGLATSCALGQFTFKFEQGRRYLVFGRYFKDGSGLLTVSRLLVDGDDVVLSDPLAAFGTSPASSITATLYHRFFEGVPAEVDDARGFAGFTGERIPLTSVLRAVAFLRGDPAIAPPDTGSAGLASGR
jgi:hypothetical protein